MKEPRLRLALPLAFLLGSCQVEAPPADTGTTADTAVDDHEDDASSNRIDIPPMVQKNLGITFATVEVRRVAETIRVPGAFELAPLARQEYRMALAGKVEFLVEQFEEVAVGDPLFRFQSPAWPELMHEIISGEQATETALSEIAVSRARIAEAQRKLDILRQRIETLAEADVKVAALEADAAELEASLPRLSAEGDLAQTRFENARRTHAHALHRASAASSIPEEELERPVKLGERVVPNYETIDWIVVRARKRGVVERLAVTDGTYAEPPTLVLSVIDPAAVRFRALALQADLPRLAGQTEALIVPPRSPGIPLQEAVPANLTLGLEAHPRERTLTLLASPERTTSWIRPGVSAFLEIEVSGNGRASLAIPRSAILQDGLVHIFFRRDPKDPDHAIRVEADMGSSDGRWVALESGVGPGDQVVLDGAYELKLSLTHDPSSSGGHVHADGSVHE